jgi:hypothetical protein
MQAASEGLRSLARSRGCGARSGDRRLEEAFTVLRHSLAGVSRVCHVRFLTDKIEEERGLGACAWCEGAFLAGRTQKLANRVCLYEPSSSRRSQAEFLPLLNNKGLSHGRARAGSWALLLWCVCVCVCESE